MAGGVLVRHGSRGRAMLASLPLTQAIAEFLRSAALGSTSGCLRLQARSELQRGVGRLKAEVHAVAAVGGHRDLDVLAENRAETV